MFNNLISNFVISQRGNYYGKLGNFKFMFNGISPNSVSRETSSNITSVKNVYGKTILKNHGVSDDTTVLNCTLVSGFHQKREFSIDTLRKMQASKKFYTFSYLEDGVSVAGKYTIAHISDVRDSIDEYSNSEVIKFQLTLRKEHV